MSIRRFSSPDNKNQDFTITNPIIEQQHIHQNPSQNHQPHHHQPQTRPLSLYDNLSTLPSPESPLAQQSPVQTTIDNVYNKNLINNNNNNINYNKNINDNYLNKINQNDFVFSDISFQFPELTESKSLINNMSNNNINNNNNNSNYNNNKNNNIHNNNNIINSNTSEGYSIPTTNNTTPTNINNQSINPIKLQKHHQYVNVDETFNKSVISDAKSSFFGLNNENISNDRNNKTITMDNNKNITNNFNNLCENNCDDNNTNNDENLIDNKKKIQIDSIQNKMVTYNMDTTQLTEDEDYLMESKPSQAVYMTTTVPQNIKGNNIMGRHTPTRNSLRHSRMLVINKNFQGFSSTPDKKQRRLRYKCPILVKLLLIFQIITGVILTSLAIWILLWAPNTRTRDNPYWSGIMLTLSGAVGLFLFEFKRSTRNRFKDSCFTVIKINSILITLLSGVLLFAAFVFAGIHLLNLSSSEKDCHSASLGSSGSCVCLFGKTTNTTDHKQIQNTEKLELSTGGGYEFHYRDLSCVEVTGAWHYILMTSAALNLFGFLIVLIYFILFCFNRTKRKYYTNVRSNPI